MSDGQPMRRSTVALLWTIEVIWWAAVALLVADLLHGPQLAPLALPLVLLAMALSLELDPAERGRPMRRRR
jgi:hypothetical protein